MTATETHPASRTDGKAVLVCPDCGREARYDRGWSVTPSGDRTEIECPDCGELVVSQPRFDPTGDRSHLALLGPLLRLPDALVRHDVL